jgi:hypothetical protein
MIDAVVDLPTRFRALYAASIASFLEHAKPGDTLCIHLGDRRLLSAFVSSASVERNTVELRLGYLGHALMLVPADRASRRLVDLEETKLARAEAVKSGAKPPQSAAAQVALLPIRPSFKSDVAA